MEDEGWPGHLFTQHATRNTQPGLHILLKKLLGFEVVSDNDDRATGESLVKQRGEERLGRGTNGRASQRSAMLQAPREGLHSGRSGDVSEQTACRRRWCVLRQAEGRLPLERGESRRGLILNLTLSLNHNLPARLGLGE